MDMDNIETAFKTISVDRDVFGYYKNSKFDNCDLPVTTWFMLCLN